MIHIDSSLKFTQIYLITNCFNKPNSVYIGKERSHKQDKRINQHKRTYGNDITFSYIDYVNSWESKDWKSLEQYWISQFKCWGFEVLNKNPGGGGAVVISEESKLRISIANKGRSINKGVPKSQSHKDKIGLAHKNKTILQSTRDKTSNSLKGRKQTEQEKLNRAKTLYKPILQYDLAGNFIKEWESITKASQELNINLDSISACVTGKHKSTRKYKFQYKL
jgi:hypothetical protein